MIWADILTLMEEQSLIQPIFHSENTGLEMYYTQYQYAQWVHITLTIHFCLFKNLDHGRGQVCGGQLK